MKVWIAVLVALALACAVQAKPAAAAAAPEDEGVFLELRPRKQTRVVIEANGELGVTVVDTEMGPLYGARAHRPRGTVDYAFRIPKAPLSESLELKVPGVLSIDGRLAPRRGEEGVEFNGYRFHRQGRLPPLPREPRDWVEPRTADVRSGVPAAERESLHLYRR